MSIQNEINRISANISAAYDAVEVMGGTVPSEQNSANLAAAIQGITAAGGLGPVPFDPLEVYKNTRPVDWLKMPEPLSDELFLLLHIPDGLSSLLAFTVSCSGSYSVEIGSVANGVFLPSSSSSILSGSIFETELFADDFHDLTSNGMKQCLVKISGTNILTWEPAPHSKKKSLPNFAAWNIVEIACRLPDATKVACGNYSLNLALKNVRYFAWYGPNHAEDMSYMFANCYSLTSVLALDSNGVTNMASMFNSCYSLTAIPPMDTAMVTNMSSMFSSCCALTTIPQMDTACVSDMNKMFYYCYSLISIPPMDTAMVTNTSGMFHSCGSLIMVPQMDTSKITTMSSMFTNCYSLAKFALTPSVSGWAGYSLSLQNCSLSYKALLDLLYSLPTISASKRLTLTGNPGLAELSDADKAVASSKNWTL